MKLDISRGHRPAQLRNAHRHRAGVPVLENAARTQPERVLGIRLLWGRHVRPEPDLRPVVLARRVIELNAPSLLDVRIMRLGKPELGFSPATTLLNHWPAQPASLRVFRVWRQVLVLQSR